MGWHMIMYPLNSFLHLHHTSHTSIIHIATYIICNIEDHYLVKQYKLDLWSKYGFNLKWLLLPQLPLHHHLNNTNDLPVIVLENSVICSHLCDCNQ